MTIDVCTRCSGYVKVFTTLLPAGPADVSRVDLASVDFDVAATERGYRRPASSGCALGVTLIGPHPRGRIA